MNKKIARTFSSFNELENSKLCSWCWDGLGGSTFYSPFHNVSPAFLQCTSQTLKLYASVWTQKPFQTSLGNSKKEFTICFYLIYLLLTYGRSFGALFGSRSSSADCGSYGPSFGVPSVSGWSPLSSLNFHTKILAFQPPVNFLWGKRVQNFRPPRLSLPPSYMGSDNHPSVALWSTTGVRQCRFVMN